MKKAISLLLSFVLVFSLCACCIQHEWKAATCTEPKTCAKCGKTEGEPLGHNWEDATCMKPKRWSVCKVTDGEPLGHTWEDATCTKPKTCSVCGKTEGTPIEHSYKWETIKEATVVLEGEEKGTCAVCGDTTTRAIDKLTPEYHWGEPVKYGLVTVEFYIEDDMYCFKMEGPFSSTQLMRHLSDGSIPEMSLMVEQMKTVLKKSKDIKTTGNITYVTMEGYGRKWVYFADMSDNSPSIVGLMVNSEREMKACALKHIVD